MMQKPAGSVPIFTFVYVPLLKLFFFHTRLFRSFAGCKLYVLPWARFDNKKFSDLSVYWLFKSGKN